MKLFGLIQPEATFEHLKTNMDFTWDFVNDPGPFWTKQQPFHNGDCRPLSLYVLLHVDRQWAGAMERHQIKPVDSFVHNPLTRDFNMTLN